LEESASYRRQLGQAEASLAADHAPTAWRHLQAARQLPGRQHDPAALDLAFRIGRWGVRSGLQAAWPVRVVEGRADRPACVDVSPDGSWAVSGGQAPVLRFWRLASDDVDESIRGSVAPYLTAASQPISDLAVSSDGRTLLTAGGWDKSVCQWRLHASKWGHRFEGHTDFVSCVAVSPDNNLALSGSYDTDLRFWSLVRNVPLAVLSGHSHWVSDVAFSPDGRRALSASGDHSLRLWDLASAACSLIFEEGHTAPVQCVVFTPDGRHALSGGWDGFICCWQVDSGRCVARLEGHDGRVNSLAVTPGGRFVFSAGSDRMIRAWRLPVGMTQDESEACVMTLQGHTQAVTGLALTPDARHVVSAAEDGLRLWELDWAYEFPGGSHPGGCEDA